eukprot:12889876-Heterocapsa_arctica.AAC.1
MHAARQAARRELFEEACIFLDTNQLEDMVPILDSQSPLDPSDTIRHTNFFLRARRDPFHVRGPDAYHAAEVIPGGMNQMGIDAGDSYHTWMTTQELLNCTKGTAEYGGLMEACRLPLMTIHTMDRPDRNHHFQQHPRPRAHDKPGA